MTTYSTATTFPKKSDAPSGSIELDRPSRGNQIRDTSRKRARSVIPLDKRFSRKLRRFALRRNLPSFAAICPASPQSARLRRNLPELHPNVPELRGTMCPTFVPICRSFAPIFPTFTPICRSSAPMFRSFAAMFPSFAAMFPSSAPNCRPSLPPLMCSHLRHKASLLRAGASRRA
jgi:hypothetical protein